VIKRSVLFVIQINYVQIASKTAKKKARLKLINIIKLEQLQDEWYNTKDIEILKKILKELQHTEFIVELAWEAHCDDDLHGNVMDDGIDCGAEQYGC